jgi:DNA recombination protein RmuC
MTELLFIVIGLAIGVVVGLLVEKSKSSAMAAKYELKQQELTNSEARMQQEMENRLAMQKAHYEEVMTTKEQASRQAQEEQEKRHQEAVDAMKLRFQETMDKVTAQVKTATDSMLKERQKEFAENSNQSLGQIVNPLRETIEKMKKAMDENTEKQTSMSGEMKANIENMMRQSMAAKESADELTRVFKHGTKVQGDWGETVLDELLQAQGLTNGIHYDTQATIKDALGHTVKSDDGSMLRPDVILHLDQRRELIIDSKVSLTAFMDYVNADNEDDRQRFLKAHIDSLQKHVKELSAKDYSSYIQPPKVKMDYVIMFVPHTGALWTALNAQPDMWRKAMEKNVFIADEQTLFAALRIINLTWTQIVQAQNHEKVYALANEMLNRVGQFWKEYDAMGKALKRLNEAYDDGRKKITEGGQSINTTANQLIKLGAKQSDKNPLPQLMDIDDIAGIPADLS